jgi:predicted phosphodiesterase
MPVDKTSASSRRASSSEPQSISIVAISDTHSAHSKLKFEAESTPDILVHSGDLTMIGTKKELEAFIDWLASLPFKHKIVIAGNHDIGLDKSCTFHSQRRRHHGAYPTPKETDDLVKSFSKNKIIYLTPEHPSTEIEVNDVKLKVYGLPHAPDFLGPNAFMRDRDEDTWATCQGKYDILMSHSPPRGFLDEAHGNRHVGCDHFLAALKRVKPAVAVFGHIHEARGTKTVTWDDGSSTLLCNAANYSHRNGSVAPPIYFTINLPSPADC